MWLQAERLLVIIKEYEMEVSDSGLLFKSDIPVLKVDRLEVILV